jgi:Mrp family chromosome partitioning ATPase/DUF971 family protein
MTTVSKVYAALKEVIDPTQNKDIVDLGYVHNIKLEDSRIALDLILANAQHPHAQQIKERAERAVLSLIGIEQCRVTLKAPADTRPLSGIKEIIAVSSCKGGVGKSTLAAHLAQELARRKFKVGLVDCDIYGPSLPTLLGLTQQQLRSNEQHKLVPIEHNGMKVMSFGFLLGDDAAIMRGPIVTRYIQQILLNTDWGELDYLLIDMPPGTGDVHLTITQTLRLSGAVIVTTPHTLSLIDVARGILMFEKVNVPILGIIENMAYFESLPSGERHFLFGPSNAEALSRRFGVKILSTIPVIKNFSQTGKLTTNAYTQQTASELIASLRESKKVSLDVPMIDFDHEKISLKFKDGRKIVVKNFILRLNSQDALSVDEMTGKSKLKPEDIPPDIAAKEITPLGNYAVGIRWNDGHASGIYSYKLIEELSKKG